MFKKLMIFCLVLMLSLFVVVGCDEDITEEAEEVTEEERYGGTYYGRLSADPPTLDPAQATDTTSARVLRNIFDRLLDLDDDLEITSAIAEDWERSDDGLVITFDLRDDIYFHNGEHLTADDVVYTFNRLVDPDTESPRASDYDLLKGYEEVRDGEADALEGLTAVDDYTVEFEFVKPNTSFLYTLTRADAGIVNQTAIESVDDTEREPLGTGPFKLENWSSDHQLDLDVFEDYYAGRAYLDEVVLRVIEESSSAFAEYEQGNIYEMAEGDLPDGDVQRVLEGTEFEDDKKFNQRLGTYYFGFNTQVEPFDDPLVRRALNHAIDKETITEVLRDGIVQPANGIIPEGMIGYDEDLAGYDYDTDKAEELLAEAGYEDGLPGTYELAYNTDEAHQGIAEAVQRNLENIGVDVELLNMEWGSYIEKVDEGDTEIFRLGWVDSDPDPDYFVYNTFHSSNIGGTNSAQYDNPEMDEMLEEGRTMPVGEEREELYREINETLMEDAPWMPVYFYRDLTVIKPFVNGLSLSPRGVEPYTNVWINPSER